MGKEKIEGVDFLGRELKVDDTVVYLETGSRKWQVGYIVDVLPKMARISSFDDNINELRLHDQIIQVN